MLSLPSDWTKCTPLSARLELPSESDFAMPDTKIPPPVVVLRFLRGSGVGVHLRARVRTSISKSASRILIESLLTFRLPPVITTLTNRRVYLMRLRARPLGTLGFSWASTCCDFDG